MLCGEENVHIAKTAKWLSRSRIALSSYGCGDPHVVRGGLCSLCLVYRLLAHRYFDIGHGQSSLLSHDNLQSQYSESLISNTLLGARRYSQRLSLSLVPSHASRALSSAIYDLTTCHIHGLDLQLHSMAQICGPVVIPVCSS